MNKFVSVLLLALPVGLIGFILFLPALKEWIYPQDSDPLPIDGPYAKSDSIFADRFREFIHKWCQDIEISNHDLHVKAGISLEKVIISSGLTTEKGASFSQEVWTKHDLSMGVGSQARALVSDGSLRLDDSCKVIRWVHADGPIQLGSHVEVGARITSKTFVHLAEGCHSRLISAPLIEWEGKNFDKEFNLRIDKISSVRCKQIFEEFRQDFSQPQGNVRGKTLFVNGDLVLEPGQKVIFPLVVRGSLYVRESTWIGGSLKAHGDLILEGSTTVIGNVCCHGELWIGDGCSVGGCLRGEQRVCLGDRVVVGSTERPEAVVGDRVVLAGRGRVHGRIRSLNDWIWVN